MACINLFLQSNCRKKLNAPRETPLPAHLTTDHLTCLCKGSNPCPNGDRARVLSTEPAGLNHVDTMLQCAGLQEQQILLLTLRKNAQGQVNALDLIQEFLASIMSTIV